MNKRIRKKKQKLAAMYASKWEDVKRIKKRARVVRVDVRHGCWGMFPDKDNYAMYLRKKRYGDTREAKIEQHFVFSEILYMAANERKKVKGISLVKEGNCNE